MFSCELAGAYEWRCGQCEIGAVFMILASWVRYAGTSKSLSSNGSYALILTGQVRDLFSIL